MYLLIILPFASKLLLNVFTDNSEQTLLLQSYYRLWISNIWIFKTCSDSFKQSLQATGSARLKKPSPDFTQEMNKNNTRYDFKAHNSRENKWNLVLSVMCLFNTLSMVKKTKNKKTNLHGQEIFLGIRKVKFHTNS